VYHTVYTIKVKSFRLTERKCHNDTIGKCTVHVWR